MCNFCMTARFSGVPYFQHSQQQWCSGLQITVGISKTEYTENYTGTSQEQHFSYKSSEKYLDSVFQVYLFTGTRTPFVDSEGKSQLCFVSQDEVCHLQNGCRPTPSSEHHTSELLKNLCKKQFIKLFILSIKILNQTRHGKSSVRFAFVHFLVLRSRRSTSAGDYRMLHSSNGLFLSDKLFIRIIYK